MTTSERERLVEACATSGSTGACVSHVSAGGGGGAQEQDQREGGGSGVRDDALEGEREAKRPRTES